MDQTREINLNQMMTLLILFIIGGSALSSTARYSGQNVWIVLLFAGAAGAVMFTLFHRISKIHQFIPFPDVLKRTFGKFFGSVLLIVYAGFFLFRTISVGNYMTAMARETLMVGANHRTVVIMLLLSVMVSAMYGLKNIGRTSEIFLVIILICMTPFLLAIFTSDVFKTQNLIPILAEGMPGIAQDIARTSFFPYGELVIFLMLFPYVKNVEKNRILRRGYIGIAITVAIIIAIDLTIVALIGANLTSNFEYSFYNAMQLVGLRGFLERLDPLAIVIMVASEYFKLLLYFFITIVAIESLYKKFTFKGSLMFISVVIVIFAPVVNIHETGFMMDIVPLRILPIFELAIPLIIWLVSELRFRKKKAGEIRTVVVNSPVDYSLNP